MQVGDLVKYIPYGHTEGTGCIGVIVDIDDGEYEVLFTDGEVTVSYTHLTLPTNREV